MSLTSREIAWRMEAINNRQSSEVELQAKLHRIPYESHNKKPTIKASPLNSQQENNLDTFIKKRLKQGKLNGR